MRQGLPCLHVDDEIRRIKQMRISVELLFLHDHPWVAAYETLDSCDRSRAFESVEPLYSCVARHCSQDLFGAFRHEIAQVRDDRFVRFPNAGSLLVAVPTLSVYAPLPFVSELVDETSGNASL
jgi:hypothetical protein